jgi:hypothetical protein
MHTLASDFYSWETAQSSLLQIAPLGPGSQARVVWPLTSRNSNFLLRFLAICVCFSPGLCVPTFVLAQLCFLKLPLSLLITLSLVEHHVPFSVVSVKDVMTS